MQGYNPGERINEVSTARRTSCPCRNLAEQKTLLLAYSLTPLPLSQPQFVHTHTPSHSRFFFPSLNHSSWQLLHWRSKMIHTRVVFACPATEDNNKLWQERAALCVAFSKHSTKGSRQERTKERMQELMSNFKIFSAKPALQEAPNGIAAICRKISMVKKRPRRKPKHIEVCGWALCICIFIKAVS